MATKNFISRIVLSVVLLFPFFKGNAQKISTVGVLQQSNNVYNGYTLFSPMSQKKTFLINNNGQLLHEWTSISEPGHTVFLNPDGTLYRTGKVEINTNNNFVEGLGGGGKVERYDWDSNLIWEYTYANQTVKHHHDFQVLPNGNVLILAWELKSNAEVIQAGRDPSKLESVVLWPDHVIEVEPQGASGGTIVWEWHVWDHLVQDVDNTKDNFGVVSESPSLVDINYFKADNADWNHINAMDYDADKDQIILSVWAFDEVWIIDHSTTTAEAKGHSGGTSGKGGDLLFRWGNPATYKKGVETDKKIFQQHNVHRIPAGMPNEGDIMLFNNGTNRLGDIYSAINIISTPEDANGNYTMNAEGIFEPLTFTYSYTAPNRKDFFSSKFSSAQQLSNGNILICKGPQGEFFEIDNNSNIVWKYINPITPNGPLTQGESPFGVNSTFRAQKLPPNYAAFDGKNLEPQGLLELELEVIAGLKPRDNKAIRIYPNPALTQFNIIGLEGDNNSVKVFSPQGNLVIELNDYISNSNIYLEGLPNGLYFVKVNDSLVQKLILFR